MSHTRSNSRPGRPPFRYQNTNAHLAHAQAGPSTSTAAEKPVANDLQLNEKNGHFAASDDTGSGHVVRAPSGDPQRARSFRDAQRAARQSLDGRSRASPMEPHLQPSSPFHRPATHTSRFHSHPPPMHASSSEGESECCGIPLSSRLKASMPFVAWILTSLGFLIAIGFWKEEVFNGLEQLSNWIRAEGYQGQAILFFLIFLTTFPPLPLYSTLIALSGYCLGAYQGAVLSYFAALTGAMAVFLLSRTYLRSNINCMMAHAPTSVRRAIRAVEKQPKLLFLIRLSPYPYNLMNALLATSRISFSTYSICTGLSLFKVIIHTTIGASIHKFSDYHTRPANGDKNSTTPGNQGDETDDSDMSRTWTIVGVVLCVALLVYLSWVARRAVDDIEDDEDGFGLPPAHRTRSVVHTSLSIPSHRPSSLMRRDSDHGESTAFLSPAAQDDSRRPSFEIQRGSAADITMSESPFRSAVPLPVSSSAFYRSSIDVERNGEFGRARGSVL